MESIKIEKMFIIENVLIAQNLVGKEGTNIFKC